MNEKEIEIAERSFDIIEKCKMICLNYVTDNLYP